MSSDIFEFAVDQGYNVRTPLRDLLTDEHLEKIRYAREHNVPWPAIAKYFKEKENINYDADTFRKVTQRITGEDI